MLRSCVLLLCLFISFDPSNAQTVSSSDASKHVGEQTTVCGQIASKHTAEGARGKPMFLDLDHAFPNQTFTIVIWETDKGKVGDFPATGNVCVTGTITMYRGVAQIVLHDAKNWSSAPKPPAL
jgi:hypothetical protein